MSECDREASIMRGYGSKRGCCVMGGDGQWKLKQKAVDRSVCVCVCVCVCGELAFEEAMDLS